MVEYSSTPYLLFMIGEYLNIVLMCAMLSITCSSAAGCRHKTSAPLNAVPGIIWLIAQALVLLLPVFAMVKAMVPRYRVLTS